MIVTPQPKPEPIKPEPAKPEPQKVIVTPQPMAPPPKLEAQPVLIAREAEPRPKQHGLAIGLGVAAGAIVIAGAIVLGIELGQRNPVPTFGAVTPK